MGNSKIEWTEQTWNPIVGCSIVSPGCTNCYAMKMAARCEAMGMAHYQGTTRKVKGNTVWTGKLALAPEATLLAPLRRKKPTMYFVNSMGDLFHEDCPDEWIDRVFAVMALCPQHTFQVLTKRAGRMLDYFMKRQFRDVHPLEVRGDAIDEQMDKIAPAHWCKRELQDFAPNGLPLPNVWLGVSTERQQEADERIPLLLQTPAAIRFVSAEPLLGAIDLNAIAKKSPLYCGEDITDIDWLIVGGESGPNARPMHPDWARLLRDQCTAAGVAFFFKQWGEWAPGECARKPMTRSERTADWFNNEWSFASVTPRVSMETHHDDAPDLYRVGKKAVGRLLDGVDHNAMPQRNPNLSPSQRTDDRRGLRA